MCKDEDTWPKFVPVPGMVGHHISFNLFSQFDILCIKNQGCPVQPWWVRVAAIRKYWACGFLLRQIQAKMARFWSGQIWDPQPCTDFKWRPDVIFNCIDFFSASLQIYCHIQIFKLSNHLETVIQLDKTSTGPVGLTLGPTPENKRRSGWAFEASGRLFQVGPVAAVKLCTAKWSIFCGEDDVLVFFSCFVPMAKTCKKTLDLTEDHWLKPRSAGDAEKECEQVTVARFFVFQFFQKDTRTGWSVT